ncbi:hypothetical protein Mal33_29980 [Rosistilla oblonga]|uniref:Uncharacterized protein n=1 Tax=Rosistilla oblonga TaxID=2527990 RepID=A0A518IV81_9BACT|nr:hypothetical protein Mal33_29980 [Rosistilla oblonga]
MPLQARGEVVDPDQMQIVYVSSDVSISLSCVVRIPIPGNRSSTAVAGSENDSNFSAPALQSIA